MTQEEYVDSDIDDPDNETKNVPPKKGSVAKAESPNKVRLALLLI